MAQLVGALVLVQGKGKGSNPLKVLINQLNSGWCHTDQFEFFKNILISRLYEQFSRNDSPNGLRMGVRKKSNF